MPKKLKISDKYKAHLLEKGYSEVDILKAWDTALEEFSLYKNQRATIGVITREILTGELTPEKIKTYGNQYKEVK